MAITDKKTGPWGLDQVYNKINQGSIWTYSGLTQFLTWGGNNYGGGGFNGSPTTRYSSPVQLPGTWSKIGGGSGAGRGFLGLKTDGTFYAWGRNHVGQLGDNSTVSRSSPIQIPGTTWGSEFSRSYSSHNIKTDGTLWSWGSNTNGELGDNSTVHRSSPVQVGSDTTWSKVATANYATMALKTDGSLWSWGYNDKGNLGHNDRTYRSSPTQVPGTTWNHITWAAAYNSGLGMKTDGTIWVWGVNSNGVLGQGQGNTHEFFYDRSSPVQVPGTWSTVNGGASSFAGVRTNGELWVWGYNPHGGLGQNASWGQGIHSGRSSPVEIFGGGTDWAIPGVGNQSNYATKTDGTLWSWGYGNYGLLGQNDNISRSSPTQVGSDDGWSEPAIAAQDVVFKRIV